MKKTKKNYFMPGWIEKLPRTILNDHDKHFLRFIWWMGFQTCHCHNKYLQKKFGYSRSTIQRRIRKLKKLKFIAIGCPNSHMRTIYPRALKDPRAWAVAMAQLKIIRQPSQTWHEAMVQLGRRKKRCH